VEATRFGKGPVDLFKVKPTKRQTRALPNPRFGKLL
jgi:hypothetical protein